MFVSVQLPVIFIDKCNVSGIETMIRDWSLQEITSSAPQSAEEHLDFSFSRAGRGLKALRRRVDPLE
jgi:hypothetical protein